MNKEMLCHLVSHKTKSPLIYSKSRLITENGKETYPVKNGIPILLDKDTAPEWHRELIEVILWQYPEEIEKMYSEIDWSKSPVPIYIEYISKLLKDKKGILCAFENYSMSKTTEWIAKKPEKTKNHATWLTGRNRAKRYSERTEMFVKESLKNSPENLLELATGAGTATAALARKTDKNCRFFTVDIDTECLGNAIGISKYLRKRNILPVCANFWYLPFESESMDAVCTNFGLDESRENEKTLGEVSRILKKGGRFVCMARKNAFMRQAAVLEPFGFTQQETVALMKKCRLYADSENLVENCCKHGMVFENSTEFAGENDVVFVLMSFVKE